jgi:hypothetical protein
LPVIPWHAGRWEASLAAAALSLAVQFVVVLALALPPVADRYVGGDADAIPTALLLRYQDRIMLGSDFPLIPYPYEEERSFIARRALPDAVARKILYENAVRFLG